MMTGRKWICLLVGVLFLLQPLVSNANVAPAFSLNKGEAAGDCAIMSVKAMDQCAASTQDGTHQGCCDHHKASGCRSMAGCALSMGVAIMPRDRQDQSGLIQLLSFTLENDSFSGRSQAPGFLPPKRIA